MTKLTEFQRQCRKALATPYHGSDPALHRLQKESAAMIKEDPKIVAMPLSKALHILATIHTRDDDQTGFVVEWGARPDPYLMHVSQHDYIEAWRSVRAHIHLQTEPKR